VIAITQLGAAAGATESCRKIDFSAAARFGGEKSLGYSKSIHQ